MLAHHTGHMCRPQQRMSEQGGCRLQRSHAYAARRKQGRFGASCEVVGWGWPGAEGGRWLAEKREQHHPHSQMHSRQTSSLLSAHNLTWNPAPTCRSTPTFAAMAAPLYGTANSKLHSMTQWQGARSPSRLVPSLCCWSRWSWTELDEFRRFANLNLRSCLKLTESHNIADVGIAIVGKAYAAHGQVAGGDCGVGHAQRPAQGEGQGGWLRQGQSGWLRQGSQGKPHTLGLGDRVYGLGSQGKPHTLGWARSAGWGSWTGQAGLQGRLTSSSSS